MSISVEVDPPIKMSVSMELAAREVFVMAAFLTDISI